MTKKCYICGKGVVSGNNVSHSHQKTKRKWLPNLQTAKILINENTPKRVRVCTSCISAGKIKKAV